MKTTWSPRGLANALTILRICIIPFLLMLFMRGYQKAEMAQSSAAWFYLGALALFGIAALTDHLDGRIARKRGITDFGKFADPIADKLLILGTLFAFKYWGGLIPLWMFLVMALREVGVTALRSALVARGGRVISASQWGKYKTGVADCSCHAEHRAARRQQRRASPSAAYTGRTVPSSG